MREDYTTESQNLGKRTYSEGRCYQVCPIMLRELVDGGVADKVDPEFHSPNGLILRDQVAILPKVTRWFTANGHDTHNLVTGQKTVVPSNLASFLTLNGFAEAA